MLYILQLARFTDSLCLSPTWPYSVIESHLVLSAIWWMENGHWNGAWEPCGWLGGDLSRFGLYWNNRQVATSKAGVPNLWDIMWLESSQTTCPLLHLWKNCLPQNWSLVPKRLGTIALRSWGNGIQSWPSYPQPQILFSRKDISELCFTTVVGGRAGMGALGPRPAHLRLPSEFNFVGR